MAESASTIFQVRISSHPYTLATTRGVLECVGRVTLTVLTSELIGATRSNADVSLCYFHPTQRAFKFLAVAFPSVAEAEQLEMWVRNAVWEDGRQRCVAVLVNPVGGRKRGKRYWTHLVEPIFRYAPLEYHLFETTSSDYVANFCTALDVHKFTDIVCVGGDGLLHQLINGLSQRPDSEFAAQIRIGVIPAGSQNALACAVGCKNPVLALYHIVKRHEVQGRLLRVTLDSATAVLSCCGVAWGVVSAITKNSQKWRKLGVAVRPRQRYALSGLKQFLSPWKAYTGTVEVRSGPDESWESVDGPFTLVTSTKHSCPSSLSSELLFPGGSVSDTSICAMSMAAKGRLSTLKFLMELRVTTT